MLLYQIHVLFSTMIWHWFQQKSGIKHVVRTLAYRPSQIIARTDRSVSIILLEKY